MKVISYNLRKNRALGEIHALAEGHKTDILCLQEADTLRLPAEFGHLKLAGLTEQNRLGLALYVSADRFEMLESRSVSLKKSLHDRVLSPAHERLLGARLLDHQTGRELVAASFHAAPLTALNSLRRHQIGAALAELGVLGPELPTIMIGDFNYPVFKSGLHAHVRDSGFELSLSDKRTYTRYKMFRGHFDFATSVGFDIGSVRTLARGSSDHLPILLSAAYTPEHAAVLAA